MRREELTHPRAIGVGYLNNRMVLTEDCAEKALNFWFV